MLQLQIEHCHRDEIEKISHALEETAALSVTLTDKQDDPILEPELGTTPLWPNVVVQALYSEELEAQLAVQILLKDYPHLSYTLQILPEQDWVSVCKDDVKPQQFGSRLWVCPTWITPPEPDAVNLILDPGLAFGTGTHPTTFLCLTWLEQANLWEQQVIDYGCGSGILALAALKLGALHVNAVDIDEQALVATQNNATSNGISSTQLTIDFPDSLKMPADILIANILLTPLINLRERFYELLKAHGTLVVSGILEEQAEDVVAAYEGYFKPVTTSIHEGWGVLEFVRE